MNPGKRVTKTPEARRTEFMDAAEHMFNEKGYDETSISDIVRYVGVAQGTFYYHFESKEEVRDAIVDRIADEVTSSIEEIIRDERLDASRKLSMVYGVFVKVMRGRERLTDYIHEERNIALHERIERRISPVLRDSFEVIIKQGNAEGIFSTPHPRLAACALLGFSAELGDEHHDHTDKTASKAMSEEGVIDMASRILGAEPSVMKRRLINKKRGKDK